MLLHPHYELRWPALAGAPRGCRVGTKAVPLLWGAPENTAPRRQASPGASTSLAASTSALYQSQLKFSTETVTHTSSKSDSFSQTYFPVSCLSMQQPFPWHTRWSALTGTSEFKLKKVTEGRWVGLQRELAFLCKHQSVSEDSHGGPPIQSCQKCKKQVSQKSIIKAISWNS